MEVRTTCFSAFQEVTNCVKSRYDFETPWKDISIQTERISCSKYMQPMSLGGCHAFKNNNSSASNRFLFWKINGSSLELTDTSYDINVTDNKLRLNFEDCTIASHACFFETDHDLIILISTNCAFFRFTFPLPDAQFNNIQHLPSTTTPSIFQTTTTFSSSCLSAHHTFTTANNPATFITGCGFHLKDHSSIFLFSNLQSSIVLFYLPSNFTNDTVVSMRQLKQTGVVSRLLGSLVTSVVGGPDKSVWPVDACVSMCVHQDDTDRVLVIAITSNFYLKIWNGVSTELLHTTDLLASINIDRLTAHSQAGVENRVKLYEGAHGDVMIGVYLKIPSSFQLHIYSLQVTSSIHLLHSSIHFIDFMDKMLDFSVSEKILWLLCQCGQEVPLLCYKYLNRESSSSIEWQRVLMQPPPPPHPPINPPYQPAHLYLTSIFTPHIFNNHNISKALLTYLKSTSSHIDNQSSLQQLHKLNRTQLQQRVVAAVEYEVELSLLEENSDMLEEQVAQLTLQHWQLLYKNCLHFHNKSRHSSHSLTYHSSSDFVSVCRDDSFSTIRPCSILENIIINTTTPSSSSSSSSSFNQRQLCQHFPGYHFSDDQVEELGMLSKCVQVVCTFQASNPGGNLGANPGANPGGSLCVDWIVLGDDLKEKAEKEAKRIMESEFKEEVLASMQCMHASFSSSINLIIDLISASLKPLPTQSRDDDDDAGDDDAGDDDDDDVRNQYRSKIDHLFSTETSTSILSETLRQTSTHMCTLIHSLITLLHIHNDYAHLGERGDDVVQIDHLTTLLTTYHTVVWAANTITSPVSLQQWERSRKMMKMLGGVFESIPENKLLYGREDAQMSILELYVMVEGGDRARKALEGYLVRTTNTNSWGNILFTLNNYLQHCMVAELSSFSFASVLLSHSQHHHLQHYLHYLNNTNNYHLNNNPNGTINFLLGLSQFANHETEKAYEVLKGVGSYVGSEEMLMGLVEVADANHMEEHYLLMLIGLFETFEMHELVVKLARHIVDSSPLLQVPAHTVTALRMKIFRNEMLLQHYHEALQAIFNNPQHNMRLDCLRQLLCVLLERKEHKLLVSMTFNNLNIFLQTEVEKVLEREARLQHPPCQSLYRLLFSFHVCRKNFRKGASAMYELGWRLSRSEEGGLGGVVEALSTAHNCLHFVSPEYAWVLEPTTTSTTNSCQDKNDGGDGGGDGGVVVVSMQELSKKVTLLSSLQMLYRLQGVSAHAQSSLLQANEVVGLLKQQGLFKRALLLCDLFNVSKVTVFEALVSRCMDLSQNTTGQVSADWLLQNGVICSLANEHLSSADKAFYLLEELVMTHEPTPSDTSVHKCLCYSLLRRSVCLPAWLVQSYKKLNVDGLLRAYIEFDLLSDASDLIMDYLEAVAGKGKEDFDLKDYLHTASDPVIVPYTSIDRVLYILINMHAITNDIRYQKVHEKIMKSLERHFKLVQHSTDAIIYSNQLH